MNYFLCATFITGVFLFGAIPFSLLLGFVIGKVDIRTKGSGNVGATNLGRTCGWRWFPLAFLLDFSKGAIPPLIIVLDFFEPDIPSCPQLVIKVLFAFAPVMGHIYSPFLKFKGGKGVATATGAMSVLMPLETAIAFCVWLVFLGITRTVGAASPAAAISLPAAFFMCCPRTKEEKILLGGLSMLLAVFVVYRHKKNLKDYFFPGDKK